MLFKKVIGEWVELSRPEDYTLSGAGASGGGSATLTTPAIAGEEYLALGSAVLDRLSSIVRDGRFNSKTVDDELDRNRIIQQEQARDLKRAYLAPVGSTGGEVLASEPGQFLIRDQDGNIVGSDPPDGAGNMNTGIYDPQSVGGDVFDQMNWGHFPNIATFMAFAPAGFVSFATVYGYYLPGDCPLMTFRRVASQPNHNGKIQTANGAWWELKVSKADIRMFGAKGDYVTDDLAASVSWLAFYEMTGTPLTMSRGIYKCTNNLVLPKRVIIHGDGAPSMASFPQFDEGDKSNMRPGYKANIKGAAFIFSGAPTNAYTTTRGDKFASTKPCLLYDHFAPPELTGFGILQDMDIFDAAGNLTTGATDNKAALYTGGLLSRATLSRFRELTIFGYFANQGAIAVNKLGDLPAGANDPDYQSFNGCSITGGVAVIGGDTATPLSEGNTGTRFTDCWIYGPDHHTRADTNPAIPCVYIDMALTTTQQGRGVHFSNCNLRTVVNDAIKLDHANDWSFSNCATEFSEVVGVTGLDQRGEIKGTANTQGGSIINVAATGHLGLRALKNQIETNGFNLNVIGTANASLASMLKVEAVTYKGGGTIAVASSTIVPTTSYHVIDATGNPTITTIDLTNIAEGQIMEFRKTNTGTVTFQESGGNLAMNAATAALGAQADVIFFQRVGSNAYQHYFSDNA
ncbi:hypothetical protein SF83666_c19730 [Sinorhizobium fredii CCBAU 83666]|nr:hypothetical protein SF83666_c19730 [Sinorhizobium fredii CCBAU 83666]